MNIYIKYYQGQIGNSTSEKISIKSNSIKVKELKKTIQDRFNIPPSNQRLTVKITKDFLVLMTDEWPLSFFEVKENGKIYLEYLQEINKQEEVVKKIISAPKSKYMMSLGIYRHITPNLESIPERDSERRFDQHIRSNIGQTFKEKDDEEDRMLFHATKKNNLDEVKEILRGYKDIQVDKKSKNGWSALHLAAYYGYSEILYELILKKADCNLLNGEGWTPLHLACYKGKIDSVKLLLNVTDIDVNINHEKFGTPLHIACQKSYVKIVSLLLLKADIE